MSRSLIFAANWKMHHGPAATRDFAERFIPLAPAVPGRELWFFVPSVTITTAREAFASRDDVEVGAQNVHWEAKGAYTGEISIPLAEEAGAHKLDSPRAPLFGAVISWRKCARSCSDSRPSRNARA